MSSYYTDIKKLKVIVFFILKQGLYLILAQGLRRSGSRKKKRCMKEKFLRIK